VKNNLIFESGRFPRGTGGALQQVIELNVMTTLTQACRTSTTTGSSASPPTGSMTRASVRRFRRSTRSGRCWWSEGDSRGPPSWRPLFHLPASGSGIGYRVRNSAGRPIASLPPRPSLALRFPLIYACGERCGLQPPGTRTSMLEAPYPELDDLLRAIGEAGRRVADIEASEAPPGTSRCACDGPSNRAPVSPWSKNWNCPGCPGTRRRVPARHGFRAAPARDHRRSQGEHRLHPRRRGRPDGEAVHVHHRRFERVTSEFNSHLAVHHDQIRATGTNFHAVIHAQRFT